VNGSKSYRCWHCGLPLGTYVSSNQGWGHAVSLGRLLVTCLRLGISVTHPGITRPGTRTTGSPEEEVPCD
jgi:hypothetical protein